MANPSGDRSTQNPGMHSNVIKESVTDNDHTKPNVSANSVPALMDKSVPQETPIQPPSEVTPTCSEISGTTMPTSVSYVESAEFISTLPSSPPVTLSPVSDAAPLADSQAHNVEVPGVIQSMVDEGACFEPATNCWAASKDSNICVNWDFSLSFSLDAQISSRDVLEAFFALGVHAREVTCVHFNPSNHLWTVLFTCSEVKYQLMGLHKITI